MIKLHYNHKFMNTSNIKQVINKQKEFFLSGKTKDINFRLENLKKLHKAIEENESDILKALNEDLGKSGFEAYATEVGIILAEINFIIKNLKRWVKPKKVKTQFFHWPASSYIYPEPYGSVLIIAPWNYPFQLLFAPLIGAMAAGNCSVLKPSEISVNTSLIIEKIIKENFSDSFVACFAGGTEVSQDLLQEKFDYIFFTGSTAIGKVVMTAAAKNLTPLTLELGGKSPVIVADDADIKIAARRIVWGKFLNAGQTCIAPDYILADKKIFGKLIDELKNAIYSFYGNNIKNNPEYCKIINQKHFNRLEGLMGEGKVLFGGEVDFDKLFIFPTIIGDINGNSSIMQEEIFGPLLPIMKYETLTEAIDFINNRPKPLALYLFSESKENQQKVISLTSSGGVCINDTISQVANLNLPFGGVGESGLGSYHGQESFNCFSHFKSVFYKSNLFDASFRYPPYKDKFKWLKKIFR